MPARTTYAVGPLYLPTLPTVLGVKVNRLLVNFRVRLLRFEGKLEWSEIA